MSRRKALSYVAIASLALLLLKNYASVHFIGSLAIATLPLSLLLIHSFVTRFWRAYVVESSLLLLAVVGFLQSLLAVLVGGKVEWLGWSIALTLVPLSSYYAGSLVLRDHLRGFVCVAAVVLCGTALAQLLESSGVRLGSSIKAYLAYIWDVSALHANEPVYGRPVGLFENPNILGMVGGCLLWLHLATWDSKRRMISFTVLLLCIGLVAFSNSRGSIAALFASALVYLTISGRKAAGAVLAIGIVALGSNAVLSFIDVPETHSDRLSVLTNGSVLQDRNFEGRVQAWEKVFSYLGTHPLGTIVPPQFVLPDAPDNQYVFYLAMGGVPFVIVFCCFLAGALFSSVVKKDAVAVGAIIFMAVNSISMTSLTTLYAGLFFALLGFSRRGSCSFNPREQAGRGEGFTAMKSWR